jgi:hypothetical protein
MAKDVITGKWETSAFSRRGVGYIKSTIKIKGYPSFTQTRRANSIWGDIENVRTTSKGHTKADIYDGRRKLATMTLHKKFSFYGNYGNELGGRFALNMRTEKGKFWDSDLASHWIYKAAFDDLF